jgi:hypothetical protein
MRILHMEVLLIHVYGCVQGPETSEARVRALTDKVDKISNKKHAELKAALRDVMGESGQLASALPRPRCKGLVALPSDFHCGPPPLAPLFSSPSHPPLSSFPSSCDCERDRVFVCVCVCVCVCVSTRAHIPTHPQQTQTQNTTHLRVCGISLSLSLSLSLCVCVCVCVCLRAHLCVHVCVSGCGWMCACTCARTPVYAFLHLHVHVCLRGRVL